MKRLIGALALCATGATAAPDCRQQDYLGTSYTICQAQVGTDTIGLYLNDKAGTPLGGFGALAKHLQGQQVLFAMNGGMYHADRRPVGLYIENGQPGAALVKRAGPGNFGLLPNGVFCIQDARADVIETLSYATRMPPCQFATQSGPMLVIDGALHPRLLPNGTSRKIRNGVGTSADGQQVAFVLSEQPVNFYDFARLFRDHLGMPNALYLDGSISRAYVPALGKTSDFGARLGPMIAITRPAPSDD